MATPQLSKPKQAAAKKPTRSEFEQYLALREKRLELDRESAALAKLERDLADRIKAYAIEAGGKLRTVECCGHRASVTSVPGTVSWLKEFTRIAGQEEAERLKREAPPQDRLKVEKL